jgi:hypothetical protein
MHVRVCACAPRKSNHASHQHEVSFALDWLVAPAEECLLFCVAVPFLADRALRASAICAGVSGVYMRRGPGIGVRHTLHVDPFFPHTPQDGHLSLVLTPVGSGLWGGRKSMLNTVA